MRRDRGKSAGRLHQELRRAGPHAAFALHHFQHHGRRLVIDGFVERREIVVGDMRKPGTNGSNGSRYFFSQVAESAPKVRP